MKSKILLGIFLFCGTLLAAESFGGIGLAIYVSDCGAKVAQVVHGSAAENAGVQNGDCLVSADGIFLEGKSLEQAMDILRGAPGEILNLEILREAKIFSRAIRREALCAQEPESFPAFQKTPNSKTLKILDTLDLPGISATVYAEEEAPAVKFLKAAHLERFDRDFIVFALENPGPLTLRLFSADGKKLRTLRFNGSVGRNAFSWDGSPYPAGNYLVEVELGEEILYLKGTLR